MGQIKISGLKKDFWTITKWAKKKLGEQKILPKIFSVQRKNMGQKILGKKKICVQKEFWFQKRLGPKKF